MSFKRILPNVIGVIIAFSAGVYAQDTQKQSPDDQNTPNGMQRGEGHGHRPGHFRRGMWLMDQLNLTPEQRQQQQVIMARHLESTKPVRDELQALRDKRAAGTFTPEDQERAKVLHQQLQESMTSLHTELQSTLTSEQRAKLEEIMREHKARMEEHRKRREEPKTDSPQ